MFEGFAAVLLGLYLADLGSGLAHWFVDRYGNPNWPIAGPHFIALTQRHHDYPLEVFMLSVWRRNGGICSLVFVAGIILWGLAWLNLTTCVALLFGAFSNIIHGWAHRSRRRNGRVIAGLQKIGVIQSRRHHARHHANNKNSHFCIITNHVNPVLEWLNLFAILEWVIGLTGLRPYWWLNRGPDYLGRKAHTLLDGNPS